MVLAISVKAIIGRFTDWVLIVRDSNRDPDHYSANLGHINSSFNSDDDNLSNDVLDLIELCDGSLRYGSKRSHFQKGVFLLIMC